MCSREPSPFGCTEYVLVTEANREIRLPARGCRVMCSAVLNPSATAQSSPVIKRALGVAVCEDCSVRPRRIAGLLGAAAAASWAMQGAPMPSAHASECPDAEVVFARGTTEAPGVGPTGEAFVDSLRSRVGAKSVGV